MMRPFYTLLFLFFTLSSLVAQEWKLDLPPDSLAAIVSENAGDERHFAALFAQVENIYAQGSNNMLEQIQPIVEALYALAEELGGPYYLRASLAEQIGMISVCPNGEPSIYTDSAKVLVQRIHAAIGVPKTAEESVLVLDGYLNLTFLCDQFFFYQDSFQIIMTELLEELPLLPDSARLNANLILTSRLRAIRKPGDLEQANALMQESIKLAENISGAYALKHKINEIMADHHFHTTGDTARIRYFIERSLESLSRLPSATPRDSFNIYWALFEAYHEAEDYPRALALIDKLVELEPRKVAYEMFSMAWRMELFALMDSTTTEPYLERALSIMDTMQNLPPDNQAEVLASAGLYAHSQGDDREALALLRRFALAEEKMRSTSGQLLLFDRGHLQPLRSRGLATLAALEAAKGNHAAASGYYQRAISKKDLQASVDKKLLRSQAAYSLDVAENQRMRDIAEAETSLSRQRAATDRRMLFWGLGIAALIAGIIAFAYLRARQDQRTIKQQKAVVDTALSEKEVLLREIHHRVKNNLQIISSLLQKQARFSNDGDAQKLAKEGQERIQSMALVHENLYQSEQLSGVNIRSYLEDLGANISRSNTQPGTVINLDLAVADEYLDLDTAIPLGLILNELLTNAYKYAFPAGTAGQIKVSLQRTGDQFNLQVSDNGVGLPADHVVRSSKSLGHNLVKGLVRQLEGSIKWLTPEQGTAVQIEF
jgi:two-component sensor histidine kinase